MSAQLIESSPVEPLVVGVHLYPGDTWFREVHVRSVTTQAPVDLSGWVFEARLGDHVGVVDASRAAEGRLAVTFAPEQTADATWGDVLTVSGTLAGGRRTFLHGSVGAAVGSSIPVGLAQKTRVVSSDVDISVYAAPRGDKGQDGSAVSVALVQRAETAEGRAVSAAGVASDAAGSADAAASAAAGSAASAGASAGAAASSATTALGAAAGIVAARDAAAASAAKANTDADRAGTSAFNAAGSAAAAQGSENAAVTARAGAETARTGAEAAKAGADTAKAGAEAARDVALATNFGGTTSAANTSIDTLSSPGIYRITWGATVAQGAPFDNFFGTIEVLPRAGGAVTQIAFKHNALSNDARRFYMRTQTGAGWGSWMLFTSARFIKGADQPGSDVLLWNEATSAEIALSPTKIPLGNADLNAITVAGTYYQSFGGTSAPTSRNYPIAGGAGVLRVETDGVFILQTYVVTSGVSGSVRGYYARRSDSAGSFAASAWMYVGSQRTDQTAGRVILTWDDLNGREQMIYGDTGSRDITSLFGSVVTSGRVLLHRYARFVTVTLDNFTLAASQTFAGIIPTGFRIGGAAVFAVGTGNANMTLWGNGDIQLPPSTNRYGAVTYVAGASEAWPATLPGAANGGIPNL